MTRRYPRRKQQHTFSHLFSIVYKDTGNLIIPTFFLVGGVIVLSGLVIYRLYVLQVIHGKAYSEAVDRQYQNVLTGQDIVRGDIYFTYHDGNRLLAATDREYFQLVINNRHITDPLTLRTVLRAHVNHDQALLEEILQKKNDPYEILVQRLSQEEVSKLQEHTVRGIELHRRLERYYPLQDLGSMVLGFVSFLGDDLRGTYGLEKYYDTILRRDTRSDTPSLLFSLFGRQDHREQENQTMIEKHIAREGSLITTIEPAVQEYFTEQIQSVDQRWQSTFTAGIIMDARTGQIVAMADSREFDNNQERQHYRNVLIEDRYEFGSVMKPLSVAIGLDTKTIDTSFSYHDQGSRTLNGFTINNFDRRGRGSATPLQSILTQSLNTGAAEIALQIGAETFTRYINQLGFGSETGVDLPYENFGKTDNIDTGREIELATASFGQGVAVTAIEMVQAWGALANDGVIHTPHLVDVIEYGDLIPARNIPMGGNQRVFRDDTSQAVTQMLTAIVDNSSTFSPYALPNHSVAIKTGTAQIARPTGGYFDDQFLHAFAGYVPAQSAPTESRYIIFLFTYKPQGVRFASTTMKDPFFNTVNFLINYFNLPPDRNLSPLANFE